MLIAFAFLWSMQTAAPQDPPHPRPEPTESAPAADAVELEVLILRLESEDPAEAEAACEALRRREPALVGPAAAKVLASEQADARRLVLRLLRQVHYDQAYSQLTRVLRRDPDARVRREACHAVAELHRDRALSHLRWAALMDPEVVVRRAAVAEIGNLKTLEAAESLLDLLHRAHRDEDAYLRGIVERALTTATARTFGANLQAWDQYIAALAASAPPDGNLDVPSVRTEGAAQAAQEETGEQELER